MPFEPPVLRRFFLPTWETPWRRPSKLPVPPKPSTKTQKQDFEEISRYCHIPEVHMDRNPPEVDLRQPPRAYFDGVEPVADIAATVIVHHSRADSLAPSDSNSATTSSWKKPTDDPDSTDTKKEEWWKRHWILLLGVAIIIAGGTIGGGIVGGFAVANRNNGSGNGNDTNSQKSGSDVSQADVARDTSDDDVPDVISYTRRITTTRTKTTIKRPKTTPATGTAVTASSSPAQITDSTSASGSAPPPSKVSSSSPTPSLAAATGTPKSPTPQIFIGRAKVGTGNAARSADIAFLPTDPCNYVTIVSSSDVGTTDPCGIPFTLPDGVTYTWEGCGGYTTVKYRLGQQGEDTSLGKCAYTGGKIFDGCPEVVEGEVVVQGNWVCGTKPASS
ncbi:hypothetical protein QBC35DRAFT_476555 [Podospora australis]|uniref:Uncharacterized protein n=1 Tax=Podospora australis TaxID=1536484 RepID=A0AAN6WNQ2_9PEZI|nr:hypothetical protein QBC35DRAFT_476555 [Podospora australis]